MKLVIACDSYKGSASAAEAARALAEGAARVYPQARIETIPIADGGEGTVDAFLSAVPGRRLWAEVSGPMGEPVKAAYAMLEDGTAVLEMCAASGLTLVPPERRNPLLATSYGTGQLIAAALDAAILGHELSLQGLAFQPGEGIVQQEVEATVRATGHIGRVGMRETDLEILRVMLGVVRP